MLKSKIKISETAKNSNETDQRSIVRSNVMETRKANTTHGCIFKSKASFSDMGECLF